MLILAHNSRAYSNMAEKSGGRSSRQSVSHIACCVGNQKRINAGCNSAPFRPYTDLHTQICMQSKPGNRAAHSGQFSPLQLTQARQSPHRHAQAFVIFCWWWWSRGVWDDRLVQSAFAFPNDQQILSVLSCVLSVCSPSLERSVQSSYAPRLNCVIYCHCCCCWGDIILDTFWMVTPHEAHGLCAFSSALLVAFPRFWSFPFICGHFQICSSPSCVALLPSLPWPLLKPKDTDLHSVVLLN